MRVCNHGCLCAQLGGLNEYRTFTYPNQNSPTNCIDVSVDFAQNQCDEYNPNLDEAQASCCQFNYNPKCRNGIQDDEEEGVDCGVYCGNECFCKDFTCKPHGICFENLGSYRCECNEGYEGKDCDIKSPTCDD